jgi:hypothetical protein
MSAPGCSACAAACCSCVEPGKQIHQAQHHPPVMSRLSSSRYAWQATPHVLATAWCGAASGTRASVCCCFTCGSDQPERHAALTDDASVMCEAVALLPNVAPFGVAHPVQHIQVVVQRGSFTCSSTGTGRQPEHNQAAYRGWSGCHAISWHWRTAISSHLLVSPPLPQALHAGSAMLCRLRRFHPG